MTDEMTDQEFNRSILGLPYHERMRLLEERQRAKQVVERDRNLTDSEMKRWDAFFRGHIEQRLSEQHEFTSGVLAEVLAEVREQIADAADELRKELRKDLRREIEAMIAALALRGEFDLRADANAAGLMAEVDRKINEGIGQLRADLTVAKAYEQRNNERVVSLPNFLPRRNA
jgi:hypothetical protein